MGTGTRCSDTEFPREEHSLGPRAYSCCSVEQASEIPQELLSRPRMQPLPQPTQGFLSPVFLGNWGIRP
ncbi:hypothetical protein VULLAG_LOCUS15384 [Vulpes lagopus]